MHCPLTRARGGVGVAQTGGGGDARHVQTYHRGQAAPRGPRVVHT